MAAEPGLWGLRLQGLSVLLAGDAGALTASCWPRRATLGLPGSRPSRPVRPCCLRSAARAPRRHWGLWPMASTKRRPECRPWLRRAPPRQPAAHTACGRPAAPSRPPAPAAALPGRWGDSEDFTFGAYRNPEEQQEQEA